ncbi:PVC-type heme-binding CxxCH protein [Limnovirga soli]|uniref:C-type cytochrome n=1 Tax=Limnovirga soli TaxID=2656915 RepID=A0A8J8FH81_9BACT|nr:PVC-type heme-binding CxxCH protein [Limnovirga soli]NNV57625.1 c-type cytochrome [Limnovirga soli]
MIQFPITPSQFIRNHFWLPGLFAMLLACNTQPGNNTAVTTDSATEAQKHLPENALKTLTVADGLEVTAMATEPMLQNPTNIDVDERGRVWVTEAYNYRPDINGNPTNALGDRIMIIEDNNGDGKADTAKVFYQGPELNAPLGICVLGNKAIVSQSPYIWIFYDDDGDDKADRKAVLFSGIDGEQHDHGVHAFTFGADGKLYFNMGNAGKTLKDKNGKDVLDQDGDVIGPKKYKEGMVFRCNVDGSNVECLGQNFRNPYEVAVDSYGTLWQSDNDDDGNKGTRINFVMEYGSYGYTDALTGAYWQANRTNIEDSIPFRHWHLNDPGTMPNLLQTGAGSPTGMVIYEGNLLPAQYYGQMIHCDPGPNVVRSYPVQNSGAGYTATISNILKNEQDQWFRPADICVAPDGSLIIADWYDPGVGGHQAGDQVRGRIYRVAPKGTAYTIPKQDYNTAEGLVRALQNPNLSVRYHAFTALSQMGVAAIPALETSWVTGSDSRMRARAFWALVKLPKANAEKYIQQAIKDGNPNIRIMAIRAARELNANVIGVVSSLISDTSAQVRRECAIALHHNKAMEAPALWTKLATAYDGKDRWYLEALGIGADEQWDSFLDAYIKVTGDPLQTKAGTDIIWRARSEKAVPYLAKLAANAAVPLQQRLRYFRAFDFNSGPLKSSLLLQMIDHSATADVALNKVILHALDIKSVMQSAVAQKALQQVLASLNGTDEYIELVTRYKVKAENNNLLQLAINKPDESVGKNAAGLLIELGGTKLLMDVFNAKDTMCQQHLMAALSGVGSKASIDIIQQIALSNAYDTVLRQTAASSIGKSWSGEERVLEILKQKKVPASLIPYVVASVNGAWRGNIRSEAASYLPDDVKNKTAKKAPSIQEVEALTADIAAGKNIFTNTCAVCHQINNSGYDFGPKLGEIGSKLPKEGLLDAIVHPSAGIGFGYEGWELIMKDGSTLTGVIASKTETDIDIKFPGGGRRQIKTADVKTLTQLKESMMTTGLYESMSTQDMANLLGYLASLKKK